jgi:SAM-dependent methyltransferase
LNAKRAEYSRLPFGEELIRNPQAREWFWERAGMMISDTERLRNRSIRFTPFLEIGASSAQRSTALLNTIDLPDDGRPVGAATDIAMARLAEAPMVAEVLGFKRLPSLICCDAHALPFLSDTFNFLFAYRSLHHFNNPTPVLAECYRVLGKEGVLFFNEEPLDTPLRRWLRGNRMHSSQPGFLERLGYRLGLENIFWDDGAWERAQGITEARHDMQLWKTALAPFNKVEVDVNNKLHIQSDLVHPRLNVFLSNLMGGNLRCLAWKGEGQPAGEVIEGRLMCLDCHSNRLVKNEDGDLTCQDCQRTYPLRNGVLRMFPRELDVEMEISGS